MIKSTSKTSRGTKKVPTHCLQCVSGPDLIKVQVEDGVGVRIEPSLNICGQHPGHGKPYAKAYGPEQKSGNFPRRA